MEKLSLNNDFQSQQSFEIATRENNEDMTTNYEPSHPQHVFDEIPKDLERSPIKRRYIGARDLRAISQNQIINELSQGIITRSFFRIELNMALICEIQPEYIDEALQDQSWIEAMQEELNQLEKSKVWTLVPLPKGHSVISTRWVF